MATKLSTVNSLKFQGTVTTESKNYSKTISGVSAEYISDPSTVQTLSNNIFAILDNGTGKTFTINKADKYSVA